VDLENLDLASIEVAVNRLSASNSFAEVGVDRTFENGFEIARNTVFVKENGVWKHRLVGQELVFFMPEATYEEFVEARESN
jgi:hypothetical protein